MQPVFLFIDLLNDFFNEPPLSDKRSELVRSVNELVSFARSKSFPIIWVRQEFEPDLSDAFLSMKEQQVKITIKGTEGCQLLEELNKSEDDFEIIKKRYSAFFNTELDSILKTLDFTHIILSGVNTHACIRAAAIDAYQRDHHIVIAADCVSSYDSEYHQESIRYLGTNVGQVLDNREIIAAC